MAKTDIKTVTLNGAELKVTIAGQNCDIRNDSTATVYASATPGIIEDGAGVMSIPAGQAAKLHNTFGTVFLLGTGKMQLCGNDYSEQVFKCTPSGGGGSSEVTKTYVDNGDSTSLLLAKQFAEENFSNPNLLINPDFNISQRGKTEYRFSKDTEGLTNAGYTFDGWRVDMYGAVTTGIVNITQNNGVATITNECDNTIVYSQRLEYNETHLGRTFTMSAFIDGQKVKKSFVCAADGGIYREYISSGSLRIDDTATGIAVAITVGGGQTMTFAEPKLEIGSVSTPFAPPDPATELAKCQRYYIPASLTALMLSANVNTLFFLCSLPVKMRTRPSLTSDTTFKMYKTSGNSNTGDEADWTLSVHSSTSSLANGVNLALTKEAHGVTAGERYLVITSGGFSAEL